MGGAFGLDFGAALALGDALEAPRDLLAEVLPAVESLLVRRANGDPGEADEADELGMD